jgi:hypothetical protein
MKSLESVEALESVEPPGLVKSLEFVKSLESVEPPGSGIGRCREVDSNPSSRPLPASAAAVESIRIRRAARFRHRPLP